MKNITDRFAKTMLFLLFPITRQDASCLKSHRAFLLIADMLALLLIFAPGFTAWGAALFVIVRLLFLRNLGCKRDVASQNPAAPLKPGRAITHVAIVLAACLIMQQFPFTGTLWESFPTQSHYYTATAAVLDAWVDNIGLLLAGPFVTITIALNNIVGFIFAAIDMVPWPILILLLTALAWRVGGWRHALWCAASLCFIGFFGFWEKAIDTASVVIASIVICILIGIPIGIAAAKNRVVNEAVVPVLDFMQTMPSFVYLLPAVAFFSLGKPPAVVATVIFAMPPLIRLTSLGIREVPLDAKEAMLANGASSWQLLTIAEVPLAWSTILAGINQCVMLAVAMVVIASLIGGGGLGYDILYALQNVRVGEGILAGTAIVCIAIVFDRILKSSRKYNEDEV